VTLLLGIDIGTTGVRAAAFDAKGSLVAEHAVACPYATPRAGWAEIDPEAWWDGARAVCARIVATVDASRIAAIAVTGQAPTVALIDGDGRALRPAILWLDTRADEETCALSRAIGEDEARRIGGNRTHAYFAGPKIAWLRRHDTRALDRATWIAQSHAFVAMRLSGEIATDDSTAALCAPLFDVAARAWSRETASAVGVDVAKLPRVARAHDVIGTVTRAAAAATGLREGTRVVAGGGDFAASALGAGVVDEGEACLMLGTAGNLLMPLRAPRFDARMINSHHVGCAMYLTLGGTLSGAAQEWFRRAVAPGVSFEELDAAATAVEPGARGLIFLPYLQGERTPIWDVRARGVFAGLDLSHERGDMWRALLEGIALSFRHCAEVVRETGIALTEVVASNGGGKSALFRQILCDVLGVPLAYLPHGGGTVAGAAILAGIGAGVLADASASRAWRGESIRHEPDATAHARYEEIFGARLALSDRVRSE
jgi:xylulokinase